MTIQYVDVAAADDVAGALEHIAASRAELLYVTASGVLDLKLREITGFAIATRFCRPAGLLCSHIGRRNLLRVESSRR